MAITDKEQGVWDVDQVYNKINQGGIWDYTGPKELWMWGYEQTGNNTILAISSPVQLPGANWDTVYSFSNTISATKTDGTLWVWGSNSTGQLGQNDTTSRSSPIQIPGTWATGEDKFTSQAQYVAHGIKSDNTLWAMGYNEYGNLGLNQPQPTQISSPTQVPGAWDKLFGGGGFSTYAIRTDGTLWSWGYNGQGELGHNSIIAYPNGQSSPKQVPGSTWDKGTGSGNRAHAIKTDGTLWSWGRNQSGILGLDDVDIRRSSPTQVGTDTTWSSVSCQETLTCAIKTDGTFWAWGKNTGTAEGALGVNDAIDRSSPVQIPGTTWTDCMACGVSGHNTAAGLKSDGTLWIWGSMYTVNPLNLPGDTHYSSPVQVPGTHWTNLSSKSQSNIGCIQIA